MKHLGIIFIISITMSCVSDFDRHDPYQSPELIDMLLEIEDSLLYRGVNINVRQIDIMLKPGVLEDESALGQHNSWSRTITIDEDWFFRLYNVEAFDAIKATLTHELGHSLGLGHLPREVKNIMSVSTPAIKNGYTMSTAYDQIATLYFEKIK